MINGKIQPLSNETINQIAAGEVVENPAAVVKELIENAIDAGSTKIVIEIFHGGFSSIRVSDNGSGMGREDAKICFERHTTSKLKEINDLYSISSMGFRGEALASIASIAKVELHTSLEGSLEGSKVTLHGGRLISEGVSSPRKGTTILVESLFYNTPARKSFQKSAAASTSEIVKVVTKASLAYPNSHITLLSHGEVLLEGGAGTFSEKVEQVLGFKGVRLDFTEGPFHLWGALGHPEETRMNRSGQYLFVNRRPVYSYIVASAVLEGYGTRLEAKRFPLFALHLELPGALVDVNVHPQKTEVRFKDDRQIASFVRRGVALAWQQKEAPEFILPKVEGFSFDTIGVQKPSPLSFRETPKVVEPLPEPRREESPLSLIHLLEKYALFEKEDRLWLIDLVAAKSRLVFDQVLSSLEKGSSSLQQFMFPDLLEFSLTESQLIQEELPLLEKVGILLRPFGKNAFLLEGLAPLIAKEHVRDILLDLSRINAVKGDQIAKIASRYARKEKGNFSASEAKQLIETFYRSKALFYCPEGKKIVVSYEESLLEKCFS